MTTIGALNEYVKDYTNCINQCDFYNTDKTKRLGFDNTLCLLKCNSYFTQLRQLRQPSERIYFPDASIIPKEYKSLDFKTCRNKKGNEFLTCMENLHQKNVCQTQCFLNESFFSPYRMKICLRMCNN